MVEVVAVAVVPSLRVAAVEFVGVLTRSGITAKIMGWGHAEVVVGASSTRRLDGVLVVEVSSVDLERVQMRAELCGVAAVPLDQARSSRANVVS